MTDGPYEEREEALRAIQRLAGAFEDLVVRGLRAAGPSDLGALQAMGEEFGRIGAGHLAERIRAVVDAVRADDPAAAGALLLAQTSLRLFERILTLEAAGEALAALAGGEGEDEDG